MPGSSDSARRKLDAIVLAAGGSTRLGRPKQLLSYRGSPLILRMTRLARQSVGGRVIVVLGDQQQRLRSLLRRRARHVIIVNNANWCGGLATSLTAGLKRVSPTASGLLVLLVDQAKLGSADIDRLIECWRQRPGRPAAAFYLGGAGAPAVIPRSWFREVRSLKGDTGARSLLRRLGDISLIDMPAAEFDVDTPAEAALLRR
jgi:CTP:molybdopterin cytidylyltransferase MocA